MTRPWGTVHYDSTAGRWRARAGDEDRTSLGLYDTQAEAEEARAEAHRLYAHQLRASGSEAAVIAYARQWVDAEERRGRRGVPQLRSVIEAHIASAPFARWPLYAVTQREVQRWILALASEPADGPRGRGQRRSQRTVRNVLSVLSSIYRAAILDEIVDVSPCSDIVLGRDERTAEDFSLLSAAEVERLRTTTSLPLRSHAAYLVATYAGLRVGELWGLRWPDVSFGGGELIVRHSRDRGTKGGKVRRVPLLEPAADILERWHAESGSPRRGLVWPGSGGRPHAAGYDAGWQDRLNGRAGRQRTQLGHRWQAGIGTRLPLKDLRHTCASHLLRGTWAPHWLDGPLRMEEVSLWLGHASVTVTERYYARLAPGALRDRITGRRRMRRVQ